MKTELFFEYIGNVFHLYLAKRGTKFPIILFVDGHSTYLSCQLSNLCSELKIILICLYANSTWILQPEDVPAFKSLKSYCKKAVLDWKRQNHSEETFGTVLKIVDTYYKSETVVNGFVATGLCPWNANAIDYTKCLGKFKMPEVQTIDLPSDLSF